VSRTQWGVETSLNSTSHVTAAAIASAEEAAKVKRKVEEERKKQVEEVCLCVYASWEGGRGGGGNQTQS